MKSNMQPNLVNQQKRAYKFNNGGGDKVGYGIQTMQDLVSSRSSNTHSDKQ
jgi:hypothetical protein